MNKFQSRYGIVCNAVTFKTKRQPNGETDVFVAGLPGVDASETFGYSVAKGDKFEGFAIKGGGGWASFESVGTFATEQQAISAITKKLQALIAKRPKLNSKTVQNAKFVLKKNGDDSFNMYMVSSEGTSEVIGTINKIKGEWIAAVSKPGPVARWTTIRQKFKTPALAQYEMEKIIKAAGDPVDYIRHSKNSK